jgi:hypothetical protein
MPEQTPDPSPDEIEAMTAEIRASWTPKERLRRATGSVAGWLPQVWVEGEDDGAERGW